VLQAVPQLVPSQVATPLAGAGHAEHEEVPQEAGEALLTHDVPHACVPEGHWQVPAWHVMPPVHALPHPPQLLLSLELSTQALPQAL
jgi:hypothetical protein